jgi:pantoate--beta-alanine ligase
MGSLHAGHLSLVERSQSDCDVTIVSIFVNPKQFSPPEEFSRYPRTMELDFAKLATLNVEAVFAPSLDEMYPPGFSTHVDVSGITEPLEGAYRPGHFGGVATVVLKLFQIAPADRAYFGRKDYQQVLTVQRLVADLNLPIEIIVCPLVRDSDGIALSSRNVFLSSQERQHATVLSRSLKMARQLFKSGERDAVKLRVAVRQMIEREPAVHLEYAAVADPSTLAELSRIDRSAVVLLAAKVGTTRLIDNEVLGSGLQS